MMDLQAFLAMPDEELFAASTALREKLSGRAIKLCAIINIRSGNCSMDCKFCAQSGHYGAVPRIYPLLSSGELLRRIESLECLSVDNIGLVASGPRLSGEEFERLLFFFESLPEARKKKLCVSLGRLDRESLWQLKNAGLRHYHHNLETSEKYYPEICGTQSWKARRETARLALEEGLELCCGGLFGLGESWEDRLSLADSLAELGVRDIPINFLIAQKGTPLEKSEPLSPREALRILALFRLRLPEASIRVCGGRKRILGPRQYDIFAAGANALMTGDYLTSPGESVEADLLALAGMNLESSAHFHG